MSTEDEALVWSSTLDGKYTVKVVWTAPYRGELTISEGENILHREPVGLSYNAQFGPDVSDVAAWQELCVEFIDNREQS